MNKIEYITDYCDLLIESKRLDIIEEQNDELDDLLDSLEKSIKNIDNKTNNDNLDSSKYQAVYDRLISNYQHRAAGYAQKKEELNQNREDIEKELSFLKKECENMINNVIPNTTKENIDKIEQEHKECMKKIRSRNKKIIGAAIGISAFGAAIFAAKKIADRKKKLKEEKEKKIEDKETNSDKD